MSAPCRSAHSRLPAGRWLTTLLLAVLFFSIHGRICFAANTYTVVQNTQLQFGTMQIPGGSVTDIISTAGGQSGTGTLLYGTVSAGDYTIKCTSGTCTATLTISISSGSLCTGLTSLGTWQGKYNSGSSLALPLSGLVNPGAGGLDFKVGTTATYTSSVSAGSCVPTFTINLTDASGTNANFSENASIGFDQALALTKNSDINFGTVTANNASTYRITPVGVVTTTAGTGAHLYGATTEGFITIAGSVSDTLSISVGGYTANNGVTPSNASCTYNFGAVVTPCSYAAAAAPGAGKALLLGVDVTTDGTQAAGTTAAPTFTISVAYQ
jgi:hypothetical protein